MYKEIVKSRKYFLNLLFIGLLTPMISSCSAPVNEPDDCGPECEGNHNDYQPCSTPISFHSQKQSYRGTLVVGQSMEGLPALQTFQPDGTEQLFWVNADNSPEVRAYFERIIRSDQNSGTFYKPRRITLNGYFEKPPLFGSESKYDGIFVATGMY